MSLCNFFFSIVWHKTRTYQSRHAQPVAREQHVACGTTLSCARKEMTRENLFNPYPGKAEIES